MQRANDETNAARGRPPMWVTSTLHSVRVNALAAGVDRAQVESAVDWIEALVSRSTSSTPNHSLADEWTTRADLRSTIWAVASHTYRSASDALAVVLEFSVHIGETPLAQLAARDLLDATAVLRGRNPIEADVIGGWLARVGTLPASMLDVDLSKAAQASACWLGGAEVTRDELDSAVLTAGISDSPLVVEFEGCYRRHAIAVLHLADETCPASDAWCADLGSGATGWFSRFGGWTPAG